MGSVCFRDTFRVALVRKADRREVGVLPTAIVEEQRISTGAILHATVLPRGSNIFAGRADALSPNWDWLRRTIGLSRPAETLSRMVAYIDHLRSLTKHDLDRELADSIKQNSAEILRSEEFSGAQAKTNASFTALNEVELIEISLGDSECSVRFSFRSEGDQNLDRPAEGDVITGDGLAIFGADGAVRFSELSTEIEEFDDTDYSEG